MKYDITLLTDARYVAPKPGDWYVENIHLEDRLLRDALERRGIRVHRTHWDDPAMDWTQTRTAVFRTTWDYFDRFGEFAAWLDRTAELTHFLNPLPMVRWNMNKRYLSDLELLGVNIPPTEFIEVGDRRTLLDIMDFRGWDECVLKPAVGGAGRHTYRLDRSNWEEVEEKYRALIAEEAMLLQAFLPSVPERGEVALMFMNGHYSHAVLKRVKAGDFRVQDDFGGTVHDYQPKRSEIEFAQTVVHLCAPIPVYGRVDMVWDLKGEPAVSELELIEPELWMRSCPESAEMFAEGLVNALASLESGR